MTKRLNETIVLDMIRMIRKSRPKTGARKLYTEINQKLSRYGINVGRDNLFELLRANNMLIRKRKRKAVTTHSKHWFRKYPNLIRGFNPIGANQLWVSDITYLETEVGFVYLFLITDAYSRKILGWHLSENLQAENAIFALEMALLNSPLSNNELIHHSDRGIQYCSKHYTELLEKHQVSISMTENGDPLENAIAERVNGILKEEWINDLCLPNCLIAKEYIEKIIYMYNNDRLHSSIDMLTPNEAHKKKGELKKHWKNYYKQSEQIICV
jgi:putative transposase